MFLSRKIWSASGVVGPLAPSAMIWRYHRLQVSLLMETHKRFPRTDIFSAIYLDYLNLSEMFTASSLWTGTVLHVCMRHSGIQGCMWSSSIIGPLDFNITFISSFKDVSQQLFPNSQKIQQRLFLNQKSCFLNFCLFLFIIFCFLYFLKVFIYFYL